MIIDLFTIGFRGNLSVSTNVESLIYALDDLRYDFSKLELYIIGQGCELYEQYLKDEAERLGLQEKIRFSGWMDEQMEKKALLKCDVVYSKSDLEGKEQEEVIQMILNAIINKNK